MSELVEILTALQTEICSAMPEDRPEKKTVQDYFARCIELANEPQGVEIARLQGKVEAYERAIALLSRI